MQSDKLLVFSRQRVKGLDLFLKLSLEGTDLLLTLFLPEALPVELKLDPLKLLR